MDIFRGEVYIVDLDPTQGSEMKKSRPCVVISNNQINKFASVVIVCPVTDAYGKNSPIHIDVPLGEGGLKKSSVVHCAQVRAIDKSRLKNKIGTLTNETLENVINGIIISVSSF